MTLDIDIDDKLNKGMGGHQSHKMLKDEWLTPPEILNALGEFDLDPCHPINAPWFIAKKTYTIEDNGLALPWVGRVWLNPPYGKETGIWLNKLATHGQGIALIFARTETSMFFEQVWNKASAFLFIEGRLFFHHVSGKRADSNSGDPSCLISYGKKDAEILKNSKINGAYVENWNIKSNKVTKEATCLF